MLGGDCPDNNFSKEQCDILAYTYPYHMKECETMKPIDCCRFRTTTSYLDTLNNKIKQFNLRHPLIQLRFNVHDCYHRPSCF